ncbi:MAG: glycoside hydrolase family 127 protein, partial [Cyclobacteriaceae bacterium]|nr:glycoside hydrolase family 127 protein [Cyclobacteriaceae bacterium]
IVLSFETPVRQVRSHTLVEENKGKIALERGPLLFCAEEADNPGGVLNKVLSKDAVFEYSFDASLLGGLGKIESRDLTAIPYYAWAHRATGEMAVWFTRSAD